MSEKKTIPNLPTSKIQIPAREQDGKFKKLEKPTPPKYFGKPQFHPDAQ